MHTSISMEEGLKWLETVCENGIPQKVLEVISRHLEAKEQ